MAEIPPAPWHLRGRLGFIQVGLLPITQARPLLPPGTEVVSVVPGHTLHVLAAARYEAGSTLAYSELLVAPALVRTTKGVGLFPTRLYVDDQTSLRGGHALWSLPKELAEFEWAERPEPPHGPFSKESNSYELTIRQGGVPLLEAWWMPRYMSVPYRTRLPVVSMRHGVPHLWHATASARARLAIRHLEAPGGSALAQQLPSLATTFHLTDLAMDVPAPDWT